MCPPKSDCIVNGRQRQRPPARHCRKMSTRRQTVRVSRILPGRFTIGACPRSRPPRFCPVSGNVPRVVHARSQAVPGRTATRRVGSGARGLVRVPEGIASNARNSSPQLGIIARTGNFRSTGSVTFGDAKFAAAHAQRNPLGIFTDVLGQEATFYQSLKPRFR